MFFYKREYKGAGRTPAAKHSQTRNWLEKGIWERKLKEASPSMVSNPMKASIYRVSGLTHQLCPDCASDAQDFTYSKPTHTSIVKAQAATQEIVHT